MSRCVALVLLLALLGAPTAEAGPSKTKARAALRTVSRAVTCRLGVAHRHLVVVALVAPEADDEEGPRYATEGLGWSDAGAGLVTVDATQAADDRLLPTGVLLGQGSTGRVTARPLYVPAHATAEGLAVRLGAGAAAADDEKHLFRGLTGPEARHLVTLAPYRDALEDLLHLERRIAGMDPAPGGGDPLDVRKGPRVWEAVDAVAKELARLPGAYGGRIRGHVAFLDEHAVEIVWARTSSLYDALARDAVHGLATYAALWEDAYGLSGWPAAPMAGPRAIDRATTFLPWLAKARPRDVEDGRLWQLAHERASRLGWLVLADDGSPLLLEAWPCGDAGPFPVPSRRPPRPTSGDEPDGVAGGSLTPDFMERYLERLKEIRRRMRER